MPVDEKPDMERRLMVRNGVLCDAPTITLSLAGDVVAGARAPIRLELPEAENLKMIDLPGKFELRINNQTVQWDGKRGIQFADPGFHFIKIIGPEPWQSNLIKFTVQEAAPDGAERAQRPDGTEQPLPGGAVGLDGDEGDIGAAELSGGNADSRFP